MDDCEYYSYVHDSPNCPSKDPEEELLLRLTTLLNRTPEILNRGCNTPVDEEPEDEEIRTEILKFTAFVLSGSCAFSVSPGDVMEV